ncbi:uncharacterized protein V6R79_023451 [Siganus canaliculatus]
MWTDADPRSDLRPCPEEERRRETATEVQLKFRCKDLALQLFKANLEVSSLRSKYDTETTHLTNQLEKLQKLNGKDLEEKLLKVTVELNNLEYKYQRDTSTLSEHVLRLQAQLDQEELQLQYSACKDQVSAALQEQENPKTLLQQLEEAQESLKKMRQEQQELQVQLDQEKLQRSSIQKEHEELQRRLEAEAHQAALLKEEQEKLQQSSVHSQETLTAQVQLEILRNQELQAELDQVRLELSRASEDKLEKSIQEEQSPPVELDSSLVAPLVDSAPSDSEEQRPSSWKRLRRFLRRIFCFCNTSSC